MVASGQHGHKYDRLPAPQNKATEASLSAISCVSTAFSFHVACEKRWSASQNGPWSAPPPQRVILVGLLHQFAERPMRRVPAGQQASPPMAACRNLTALSQPNRPLSATSVCSHSTCEGPAMRLKWTQHRDRRITQQDIRSLEPPISAVLASVCLSTPVGIR